MEIAAVHFVEFSQYRTVYSTPFYIFHSHASDVYTLHSLEHVLVEKRHDVKRLASRRDHFTLDWLSSLTIILDEAPQRPTTGSGPSKAKSQF
jgi:hypothetical protein